MIFHTPEGPNEGYEQKKPQPVNAPSRREIAAFTAAIHDAIHSREDWCENGTLGDALAVLAMPEMQAIKQALHDVVAMRSPGSLTPSDTVQSVMLRNMSWAGLPDSVQAWVLS